MEQTFMTIHNLTPDANILYVSDSIVDILGYQPQEVLGRSCFDYFHPDEVPFARSIHSRGVLLDKAAVLHYARIVSKDGRWVSCECCFTIVHDVLVACTSIYRRGEKSERRAMEAPQIRRIFSCSPRDPRYHMLEHLSPKFRMPPVEREPRAALILNRFTRTLSVMFATEAISSILGVTAEQVRHKSFYECIQEGSLSDAFSVLESAKANDSIAYLRFWSRDPRRPEDFEDEESEEDEEEEEEEDEGEDEVDDGEGDGTVKFEEVGAENEQRQSETRRSSDSEEGGVRLDSQMDIDSGEQRSPLIKSEPDVEMQDDGPSGSSLDSRTASSMAFASSSNATAYQTPPTAQSSRPSTRTARHPPMVHSRPSRRLVPSVELEAVVSCTSDGLVVVLRKARPRIPDLHPPLLPPFDIGSGLFAAPWAQRPIQPQYSPEMLYNFRPPLLPQFMPLRENVKAAGGPPLDQLMSSIRDVAVFAWAVVGINGNLAAYSRGKPLGEAQPPDGLPIWDPNAGQLLYQGPENQAAQRWARFEEGQGRQQAPPGPSNSFSGFTTDPSSSRATMAGGANNYYLASGQPWQSQSQQQPGLYTQPFVPLNQNGIPSSLWQRGQTQLGTSPGSLSGQDREATNQYDSSSYQAPPSSNGMMGDYRYLWRP